MQTDNQQRESERAVAGAVRAILAGALSELRFRIGAGQYEAASDLAYACHNLPHFEAGSSHFSWDYFHRWFTRYQARHGIVFTDYVELIRQAQAVPVADRLGDEDLWMVRAGGEGLEGAYVVPDQSFPRLEVVCLGDGDRARLRFEGRGLDAPNLKALQIAGRTGLRDAEDRCRRLLGARLEQVEFSGCKLDKFPAWLRELRSLESLSFRSEEFTSVPEALCGLAELRRVSFEYCHRVKVVPDSIRRLTRLRRFDLWGATLDYLSPELFRLPCLEFVNLAYTRCPQTPELLEAVTRFLERDGVRLWAEDLGPPGRGPG